MGRIDAQVYKMESDTDLKPTLDQVPSFFTKIDTIFFEIAYIAH